MDKGRSYERKETKPKGKKEARKGGRKKRLISSICLSYSADMSHKDDKCLKKIIQKLGEETFFFFFFGFMK